MAEHRLFHQRIAGTDRDAVAARDAARFADGSPPSHKRADAGRPN